MTESTATSHVDEVRAGLARKGEIYVENIFVNPDTGVFRTEDEVVEDLLDNQGVDGAGVAQEIRIDQWHIVTYRGEIVTGPEFYVQQGLEGNGTVYAMYRRPIDGESRVIVEEKPLEVVIDDFIIEHVPEAADLPVTLENATAIIDGEILELETRLQVLRTERREVVERGTQGNLRDSVIVVFERVQTVVEGASVVGPNRQGDLQLIRGAFAGEDDSFLRRLGTWSPAVGLERTCLILQQVALRAGYNPEERDFDRIMSAEEWNQNFLEVV